MARVERTLSESYWAADKSRPIIESTLIKQYREVVAECPERIALVWGDEDPAKRRKWTYAELLADTERIATALLNKFKPGESVAVWGPNSHEWVRLQLGFAMAGLLLTTVNPAFKAKEVGYLLNNSKSVGIFAISDYRGAKLYEISKEVTKELPMIREVVSFSDLDKFVEDNHKPVTFPEIKPMDPLIMMYTSGTTGAPKGVLMHNKGVINACNFVQERGNVAYGAVYINVMPMFHIGSSGHGTVGSIMRRATHVLLGAWEPKLFLEMVESEKGTNSLLVPTMIEALLAYPDRKNYNHSTFTNMTSGASIVEPALIERVHSELHASIYNTYGQTEMHGTTFSTHKEDTIADQSVTVGQPFPHLEVKIADTETGKILPIGAQGEICHRGYQSMIGYFNNPEATKETIVDGWVHSGDLGEMDARGYVKITGRKKEMIIRGGENIYPREIENTLMEHPQVGLVAVVGVPDQYWGEKVGAVIIPKSADNPPSVKELDKFCKDNMAGFKRPRLWYIAKEFPYTLSGKIQKFMLVKMIQNGELPGEET
ncbi:MAG: class I adenylate-forming enzyme family protein [Smithellaceae bacterium]